MEIGTIKRSAVICLTLFVGVGPIGLKDRVNDTFTPALRGCVFPGPDSTLPTVIADLSDGVSSDGRGPYLKGIDGVFASRAGGEAIFAICWKVDVQRHTCADTTEIVKGVRRFAVNLSKPIPGGGGIPLGTVASQNAGGFVIQRGMIGDTVQNLYTMAVGQTETAAMMSIAIHVNGRKHLLQMGPQAYGHCSDGTNLVHGKGTSSGTITRASLTKWVMDLPAESVGRLFDIEESWEQAVDKGLYYVHLHYEIGR